MPDLGVRLDLLQHDGQPLTPETHADCPGRGAFFYSYSPLDPVHYCDDPTSRGHQPRYQASALSLGDDAPGTSQNGPAGSPTGTTPPPQPDPTRRLVIEGNKAWTVSRARYPLAQAARTVTRPRTEGGTARDEGAPGASRLLR
jgi:ParB family chromosome partitioning protein